MKVVITELGLISRLFDAGFLNRFSPEDIRFFIIDYCYNVQQKRGKFDSVIIQKMLVQGMLNIVNINEKENEQVAELSLKHPNFLFESIVSLVYANQHRINFFSEDPNLMSFAFDFSAGKIEIHSKGLLISSLIHKLSIEEQKFDKKVLMAV